MTIKVTITNSDSRESAVISVEQQFTEGLPHTQPQELKGGESAEHYVHSTLQLVVREVSQ